MSRKTGLPFLVGFILLVIYLTSRLWNLTVLPMFVDEAIHIHWAIKIADEGKFADATNSFRLLPIWLISLAAPLATNNLLLAGRLVSVGVGIFGLGGCYWLGKSLFDRRVGLITAFLYLFVPYTFFYDRMVLVDSLLAILSIYIVLFSFNGLVKSGQTREGSSPPKISGKLNFNFVHTIGWRYSLALGLMLALIINTKINGLVLAGLPLIVLIVQLPHSPKQIPWQRLLLSYGLGLLGIIPLLFDNSLEWWQIGRRVWLGRSELAPWMTWQINAESAVQFLAQNLSVFVFIAACIGVGLALLRRRRNELMLVVIAGLNIAAFIFISKAERWYPRYLLPAVPFLLLLTAQTIALGLNRIRAFLPHQKEGRWEVVIASSLTLTILLPALWFDYWLIIDPSRAPFAPIDRWQYVSGVHAGYGFPETAHYLRQQLAQNGQIIVVYNENPSVLPDTLQVYLYDRRAYIIHHILDFSKEDPNLLAQNLLTQARPVFIVTSHRTDIEEIPPLDFDTWTYTQRVAHFERPGGITAINIYRGKQ